MPDVPIQSVVQATGPSIGGKLPKAALEKGALTVFEDGDAVFTGNDSTTCSDVCSRLIQLKAEKDEALGTFVGQPEAGYYTAQQNLLKNNPHLKSKNPDAPVPAGEQFFVRGSSLKELLAPFKGNLGKLRGIVADAKTGMGGASTTTGAGIHSKGLNLPMSGEPAPQPSGKMSVGGVKPPESA